MTFKSFFDITVKDIQSSGHTPEDIIFIGSEKSGYSCTWDEFKELCKQQIKELTGMWYDAATDLIIVFKDGMKMDRHNNDRGYEDYWRYQIPFTMPKEKKSMSTLFGYSHDSIEEMHTDPTVMHED